MNAERINKLAADYSAQFSGLERWLVAGRPHICPFSPVLEAVPTQSHVLDIGCGTGLLLYMLGEEGKVSRGTGVDIAAAEVAAGRRALIALNVNNVELRCVSDTSSWPSNPFDVVTMIDVLHHCEPGLQRQFFQSACERVKKGGRLIYKDMCQSPFWMAWANRLHDLIKAHQWIHYVPIRLVESWASSDGFNLVARDRIDMYVYGHELLIFERVS
jgi:cyclopropane fatty-acyl-phospholipid synthase-like methyltransferase